MKKLFLLMSCILLFTSFSKSQETFDFNNYQLLKSSGKIPEDITKLYMEKYKEDKSSISKSDKRSENKAKDEFLQESNYYINQLLISGKILFNDPITNYINGIADVILKDQPDLRKSLRFYTVKSPSVNAFSTDKGIIFVNLGLVAQVTSEAQLAFVLSHEIVHYAKKHNMDFYLSKKKIEKNKSYDQEDVDESFLKVHHRSREMESEADDLGLLDYYSKTNYALTEIDGAMDVLQYAYLPFDDIKFDKSYFESPYFKFPDNYRLDNITPIKGRDDYDDTLSTHPNVLKRREALKDLIKSLDNNGKQAFIQSKEKFTNVKNLARFECINQYIVDQDYVEAFYNSYIMLKDNPTSFYLHKSMASSLYLMAKHKIDGKLTEVVADYKKREGESQQLNYLFRKFEKKDFCAVAIRNIWQLYKLHPENEYLTSLKDDMFKNMFSKGNIKPKDLAFALRDTSSVNVVADSLAIEHASNKYDRIKSKKKTTESKGGGNENYFKYILVDMLQDTAFKRNFNNSFAISKVTNEDEDNDEYESYRSYRRRIKNTSTTKINNILVFNPLYFKIDERKSDMIRYMDSDQKQKEYIDKIKRITNKLSIKTNMLIPSEFTADDTETYNDYSLLKDWLTESFNMPNESTYILNSSQNVSPLIKKYNTQYIDVSGVLSARTHKMPQTYSQACLWSVYLITIPYSIYLISAPDYYSYYFHTVLDLKTGQAIYYNNSSFYNRDRNDYLNSKLYDSFNQIRKGKNLRTSNN